MGIAVVVGRDSGLHFHVYYIVTTHASSTTLSLANRPSSATKYTEIKKFVLLKYVDCRHASRRTGAVTLQTNLYLSVYNRSIKLTKTVLLEDSHPLEGERGLCRIAPERTNLANYSP